MNIHQSHLSPYFGWLNCDLYYCFKCTTASSSWVPRQHRMRVDAGECPQNDKRFQTPGRCNLINEHIPWQGNRCIYHQTSYSAIQHEKELGEPHRKKSGILTTKLCGIGGSLNWIPQCHPLVYHLILFITIAFWGPNFPTDPFVKIESFMNFRAKTIGCSGKLNGLNGLPNSHSWENMIKDRKIVALVYFS